MVEASRKPGAQNGSAMLASRSFRLTSQSTVMAPATAVSPASAMSRWSKLCLLFLWTSRAYRRELRSPSSALASRATASTRSLKMTACKG